MSQPSPRNQDTVNISTSIVLTTIGEGEFKVIIDDRSFLNEFNQQQSNLMTPNSNNTLTEQDKNKKRKSFSQSFSESFTQVLHQTTSNITKGLSTFTFKTRHVQLRTNELLIYAVKENSKNRKLKANISLIKAIVTKDTLYKNCIRIETQDKIIHIQIDLEDTRQKWLKSITEQTQILSKRKEGNIIASLSSSSLISLDNEDANNTINENQQQFTKKTSLVDLQHEETSEMIQNFINELNNLDPKKYFNPASNISSNPSSSKTRRNKLKSLTEISGLNNDSLVGIKFTKNSDSESENNNNGLLKDNDQDLNNHVKDQLSILTTEFSHLNNFTFSGGLAHLALIGNRIMEKASIEVNTQSILNMSGGSQILKQGYLLKAGPNSHQPWKKRYCVLTESCEFRYMSKIGQSPKGLFSLEGTWASRINNNDIDDDIDNENNTTSITNINNTSNKNINSNTSNKNINKNTNTNINTINNSNKNMLNTSTDSDTIDNGDENFNQLFKTNANSYQFQIETSERIYKFQAPSYQSLKSWLSSLEKVGCKVKIDENDGIVKTGYLLKERTSNHWNKRYLVLLESNELKYYGKKNTSLKGTIDLEDSYITKIIEKHEQSIVTHTIESLTDTILLHNNNSNNNNTSNNNGNSNIIMKYKFKIHTPQRSHLFETETEKELDEWIQIITKYGSIQRNENDSKPIFKNRLAKYYLKTTEQVILERQEKLQDYIVSEDSLRSKLERNKNNASFRVMNNSSFLSNTSTISMNSSHLSNHGNNNHNHNNNGMSSVGVGNGGNGVGGDHQSLLTVQTAINRKRNSRAYAKSETSLLQSYSMQYQSLLNLKPGETPPPPTSPSHSLLSSISASAQQPVISSPPSSPSLNVSLIAHVPEEEFISDDEEIDEIEVLKIEPIEKYIPPSTTTSSSTTTHDNDNDNVINIQIEQPSIIIESSESTQQSNSNTNNSVGVVNDQQQHVVTLPVLLSSTIPPSSSSDSFQIIVEDLTMNEHEIETINNIDDNISDNISNRSSSHQLLTQDDHIQITHNNNNISIEPIVNNNNTSTTIDNHHHDDMKDEEETHNEMEIDYSYNVTNPIDSSSLPYTSYQIIPNLNPTIVIDNGSGILKAGFANQDFPICVFNNMIGRLKQYSAMRGVGVGASSSSTFDNSGKKLYFGDGAQSLRGVLQLSYPVERGIVKNFDDCEMMLQYTQDCLKLETFSEHPLLITESTINPKQNRERITQMMFETFDVPFLYMAKSPVLSLFAHGYTTGLVLDSGDGVTHTVPIYEGYSLPHAVQRLELAGKDLTSYMLNLLNQSGQSSSLSTSSSSYYEIIRCLKEDLSFVKSFNDIHNNSNDNNSITNKVNYDLPDGTSIQVGDERFKCPELLFNPSLNGCGSEQLGIHELCKKTIYDCDIDLRKTLASNIFLSGGSTKFNGFQARLQDEIQNLLPYSNKVKVKGSKDVQFLPWIGGSIISKISRFPYDCISRQEYEETGPYYCHVKFM